MSKRVPVSYIRYIQSLSPEALVRVYSYQSQETMDRAVNTGYWTGLDPASYGNCEEFIVAYRWMQSQMRERIPAYSGDYPMWGWLRRINPRGYKILAGDEYRITALVPRNRILLSDYYSWHNVLNGGLICDTEAEYFHFFDKDRMLWENSWRKCLEFNVTTDAEKLRWGHASLNFFHPQVCIDRIYPHEVVNIRRYDTKGDR